MWGNCLMNREKKLSGGFRGGGGGGGKGGANLHF